MPPVKPEIQPGSSGKEVIRHRRAQSDLLIHLQKIITARRLKQAQAAKALGVTQPRVSDLLRGRIDLFSTDTLIRRRSRSGPLKRLVRRRSSTV